MSKFHTYDTDIVAWAEEQASLLRTLSRESNLSNVIDWDNIAEEIETVGRSETRAVMSAIKLVFLHLMKLALLPNSSSSNHWKAEIVGWLTDIRTDFTPSMAQKINVQDFWKRALREMTILFSDTPEWQTSRLHDICPFELHELLNERFGPADAVRVLNAVSNSA